MKYIISDSGHLAGTIMVYSVFLAAAPVAGQQVFTEVSSAMGISGQTSLGDSVGWCDIDNDRDPDLAIAKTMATPISTSATPPLLAANSLRTRAMELSPM